MDDLRWLTFAVLILFLFIIFIDYYIERRRTKKNSNDNDIIVDRTIAFEIDDIKEFLKSQGFLEQDIIEKEKIILQNLERLKQLQEESKKLKDQNPNEQHLVPTYDVNGFIIYSREEFLRLYTGNIYPTTPIKTSPTEYTTFVIDPLLLSQLPSSFDWNTPKTLKELMTPEMLKDKELNVNTLDNSKTYNILPPAFNQEQCGSCYACSSSYIMSAAYNKTVWLNNSKVFKLDEVRTLSPQFIVDCDKFGGNQGCDGGYPVNVYEFVSGLGYSYDLQVYPYNAQNGTCRDNNDIKTPQEGRVYIPISNVIGMYYQGEPTDIVVPEDCNAKLSTLTELNKNLTFVNINQQSIPNSKNYRSIGLFIPTSTQIKQIQYMLRYYGPFTVCICADGLEAGYVGGIVSKTYVNSQGKTLTNPLYEPCGQINHAVILAGYEQDASGRTIWIIRNSWGTNWGINGNFKCYADEAYIAGITGIILDYKKYKTPEKLQ